jgi:hypothetical protein
MPEYFTQVHKVECLSPSQIQRIVELYLQHYDAADEKQVIADLESKREILLLESKNTIVGFTSLQLFNHQWRNQPIRVVFSGDTVVDRSHWGQQAMAYRWIRRIDEIKHEAPEIELYWFVIIKGHRTFKYLPTFARSFYPHWSIDRTDLKPLADYLAQEMFGEAYNPERGIVEFERSRGHLKPSIAEPTPEEKQKQAVRFFLERNPNYRVGHELVCLCELELSNMKPFTRRLLQQRRPDELAASA